VRKSAVAPRREAATASRSRFSIRRELDPASGSTLAADVRRGLAARRKSIPPKHFYDDAGSRLFERICDLPEYYLTRTEERLLTESAREILSIADPADLIELGSGAAGKIRILLDEAEALGLALRYRPMDVCEPMLATASAELLERYAWLEVHALVADYERHLDRLPPGERRLVAFLGSTIGNLPPKQALAFVATIGAQLRPGEHLLIGADLVKPVEILEAAYDDAAGVTAEFNRNVLRVMNRELGADFDPDAFDHVAFFNRRKLQVEMHLRARRPQTVSLAKLGMDVAFRSGETLHTEISRKFTRRGLDLLCRRGGFTPVRWFVAEDPAFALVLCERSARRNGNRAG
jgi:L-histidine N-alpha-methyltransferase